MGAVNKPAEPTRRFLTLEEVADALNVGVPLVRSLVKTGELRALQVGGRRVWWVEAADVEDYIAQSSHGPS